MLLMKAAELKQAEPSAYMVEMARTELLHHVNSLEAVDFLDMFLSMNPDCSGRVKFHDSVKVLRLKTCTLSEEGHELFALFDTDGDGKISKDEFLTCLRKNPLLIALFSPCLLRWDHSKVSNRLREEIT